MNESPFKNAAMNPARGNSALGYSPYSGVNTTRQEKFQARESRRWGDAAYWNIPAPVLWLEDPFVLSPFDDVLFVAPAFVDIWAL